jgi:hypothetical protein
MKPGRELDALIAEKVMGLFTNGEPDFGYTYETIPPYSTDIAAAWEVVEKMVSRMGYGDLHFLWEGPIFKPEDKYLTAEGYPLGTTCWYIRLENAGRRHIICAPTAPHAICLAALRALT